MTDTFKTIASPSTEILFKEKNSKFFGYAFPVTSEDEIKSILNNLNLSLNNLTKQIVL